LGQYSKLLRQQIYEAMNVVQTFTDPAETAGFLWLSHVLHKEADWVSSDFMHLCESAAGIKNIREFMQATSLAWTYLAWHARSFPM